MSVSSENSFAAIGKRLYDIAHETPDHADARNYSVIVFCTISNREWEKCPSCDQYFDNNSYKIRNLNREHIEVTEMDLHCLMHHGQFHKISEFAIRSFFKLPENFPVR